MIKFKENRENAFAQLMEEILNQVLVAESDAVIGALPVEASAETGRTITCDGGWNIGDEVWPYGDDKDFFP